MRLRLILRISAVGFFILCSHKLSAAPSAEEQEQLRKKMMRSTVYIETQLALSSRDWGMLPKEAQERLGRRPSQPASGSGFLITDDGYLITNAHVINGITYIVQLTPNGIQSRPVFESIQPIPFDPEHPTEPFTLSLTPSGLKVVVNSGEEDEETYQPHLVKVDAKIDLALLKISGAEKFPHFDLNLDEKVETGMNVVMLGFPGGKLADMAPFVDKSNAETLSQRSPRVSMNAGMVSSVREYQGEMRYQLAVSANHGNSGGPITDRYGKLIGVLYAGIDQMQNINYAIPGKYLSKVCNSEMRAKLGFGTSEENGESEDSAEDSGDGDQSFKDFLKSGNFKFDKK
ncbi:trypsin-like peptidase domain-containing protein [Candidatus Sumerlaeota bacterium]|nr:trypsin-like peptidase domain-containing protein [Candidatus Sumerlaeota bacterium]MBI3736854.1 trypsin-like peptidase domain-containing protein [Candidatus Sumerlaeota bacterium]